MAWQNISGFELGDISDAITSSGTLSVQTSVVRTGTYALRTNPTTTAVGWCEYGHAQLGGFTAATIYTRFYFRAATLPASASEEIMVVRETTTPADKMTLRITSAGVLQAYDSAVAQIGSDSPTALSTNTWYLIEVSCATGAAAAVEVKINGVSEISGNGNTNVNNCRRIRYGKGTNRNGQSVDFFYDDVAIRDDAYPGAGSVAALTVDADGSATAWTIGAGAGSDYENVDERPHDSDTTYLLSTLSIGDASLCGLISTAAAGITGTINAVKSCVTIKRDGAASGTVTSRIRSGGSNNDQTGHPSGAAYLTFGEVVAVDPSTSVAWTLSGLDSVEVGVVEGEATDRSRVTHISLMVDYVPAASGLPSGSLALMGVGV